jgi:flagellar biosynthetic protein FliP
LPAEAAVARTGADLKAFMLTQTRAKDLGRFAEIAGGGPHPAGADAGRH